MAKTVQITDVEVEEFRIWRQDENGTIKVYAAVGFKMTTNAGFDLRGDETVELTGQPRTRAATLRDDIIALVKAKRGI